MKRHQKIWTPAEDRLLEDSFRLLTNRELSMMLGRTPASIMYRGQLLGLRKSAGARSRAAVYGQAVRRGRDVSAHEVQP